MVKLHTFSDRLTLCLDKLGFPPKNCGRIQLLSEMVGLSHRGAGKWLSGESSPPSGKFPILAKQLQVNEHWLRTGEGLMCSENDPLSEKIGVIQDIPLYLIHQIPDPQKQPYQMMTCILPYSGDFYGLVLKTESMSPRFPLGSIIIFDATSPAKDGDFVLAADPNYPEPLFRQLLMTDEAQYLHAYNPKFDRLSVSAGSCLLGKLIQAIVSFD